MNEERSQAPTPRKRQEARQQGRVVASTLLVGAIVWLGAACFVVAYSSQLLQMVTDHTQGLWSEPTTPKEWESSLLPDRLHDLVKTASFSLLGMACGILAIAVLGRLAQVGFIWAPSRIGGGRNRMPLSQRAAELFSLQNRFLALRGIIAFGVLLSLLAGIIWYEREVIASHLFAEDIGSAAAQWLGKWGLLIGGCLFAMGMLDYAFQRYQFEQSLHMTQEEFRAEIRAVQANVQIGAERERLHREQIQTAHPEAPTSDDSVDPAQNRQIV